MDDAVGRNFSTHLINQYYFSNYAIETSITETMAHVCTMMVSAYVWSLRMLEYGLEWDSFTLKHMLFSFFTDTGLYII